MRGSASYAVCGRFFLALLLPGFVGCCYGDGRQVVARRLLVREAGRGVALPVQLCGLEVVRRGKHLRQAWSGASSRSFGGHRCLLYLAAEGRNLY